MGLRRVYSDVKKLRVQTDELTIAFSYGVYTFDEADEKPIFSALKNVKPDVAKIFDHSGNQINKAQKKGKKDASHNYRPKRKDQVGVSGSDIPLSQAPTTAEEKVDK